MGLFADYSQWELAQSVRKKPKPVGKAIEPQVVSISKKRLSYLDSREWESMEEKILLAEEMLERKKAEVQAAAADAARLQVCYLEMLAAQEEVDQLYARWAELEGKVQGA
jgi:ATP-binding cassette subfamily F protein uup